MKPQRLDHRFRRFSRLYLLHRANSNFFESFMVELYSVDGLQRHYP
jgi:hypothetical protein